MERKKNIKASLIADQDYLETLLKLLTKAGKSIDLMAYSFAIGSAAGKINEKGAAFEVAKKLVELKSKRGKALTIRLFTEGHRETVSRNEVTAQYLESHGVLVQYGSTHAKGFCIDGKILFLGSTNLTNQSIRKNFEANLLIEDSASSREFLKYFNHHWNGGGHGEIHLKAPLIADGEFKDELIKLIQKAKKKIDFSIYFFNHREIEKALVEAFNRGVEITGFIHQHASFAYPYIRANRATVKRLRAAGLNNLFFGPRNIFSHAKYLVVDGVHIMLGTGNWLVEDVEVHPQLYLILKDKKLANNLIKHLKNEIDHATDD